MTLILMSCGSEEIENTTDTVEGTVVDKEKFLVDLAELEAKLEKNNPDKADLKKAVIVFNDFAKLFPEDPKAPEYLLKSSDIALTTGKHKKSVETLEEIIEKYPDYEKIESVYYNRASHTDFELRDTTLARQYYTEFMEKFPESDFINDAQARIDQNFMSIEDLVNSFMDNLEVAESE
jgi:tetratricopeptide (TPR) repeat protein